MPCLFRKEFQKCKKLVLFSFYLFAHKSFFFFFLSLHCGVVNITAWFSSSCVGFSLWQGTCARAFCSCHFTEHCECITATRPWGRGPKPRGWAWPRDLCLYLPFPSTLDGPFYRHVASVNCCKVYMLNSVYTNTHVTLPINLVVEWSLCFWKDTNYQT